MSVENDTPGTPDVQRRFKVAQEKQTTRLLKLLCKRKQLLRRDVVSQALAMRAVLRVAGPLEWEHHNALTECFDWIHSRVTDRAVTAICLVTADGCFLIHGDEVDEDTTNGEPGGYRADLAFYWAFGCYIGEGPGVYLKNTGCTPNADQFVRTLVRGDTKPGTRDLAVSAIANVETGNAIAEVCGHLLQFFNKDGSRTLEIDPEKCAIRIFSPDGKMIVELGASDALHNATGNLLLCDELGESGVNLYAASSDNPAGYGGILSLCSSEDEAVFLAGAKEGGILDLSSPTDQKIIGFGEGRNGGAK